jgi:hypothetical protein
VSGVKLEIIRERIHLPQGLSISFQRAGEMPEVQPQRPVNLGALPVHDVRDFPQNFPQPGREIGSVFVPLLENETMWLGFASSDQRAHAVQMAVGTVDAITGRPWIPKLQKHPQNYLVVPLQNRWSGIGTGPQFIPFSLRSLRDDNGVQKSWILVIYKCRPGSVKPDAVTQSRAEPKPLDAPPARPLDRNLTELIADPFGLECWEEPAQGTLYIHAVTGREYQAVTGTAPPSPRSASEVYRGRRLP